MSRSGFSIHDSVCDIDVSAWNGILPEPGEKGYYPFTDTRFLAALEESGSVGPGTGWQAAHLALEGGGGFVPLYLKGHSQGEYAASHAGEPAGGWGTRDLGPVT